MAGIEQEPYYQALLHVSVTRDERGESRPKNVELIEARKLDVAFSRT